MPLIRDDDVKEIQKRLQEMKGPVKLVHFTQESGLEYGLEARQLLEELAPLSEHLSLEVWNFEKDREKATEYGIDKVPATVVRNGRDFGIRFYGLPAGYEFSTLLDAILTVSQADSGLEENTRKKLSSIQKPVHLQVFVTPT